MIAASTHPWAIWHQQVPVEMERYRILSEAHQSLARRMVICGTHVHAGIEDPKLRIELMNQVTYFLPHLLALSTSSPFWEGFDTGLKAFRPTIFGNLPRSGLPEQFESFADWSEMLELLAETGTLRRPDQDLVGHSPQRQASDARDAHLRHVHARRGHGHDHGALSVDPGAALSFARQQPILAPLPPHFLGREQVARAALWRRGLARRFRSAHAGAAARA